MYTIFHAIIGDYLSPHSTSRPILNLNFSMKVITECSLSLLDATQCYLMMLLNADWWRLLVVATSHHRSLLLNPSGCGHVDKSAVAMPSRLVCLPFKMSMDGASSNVFILQICDECGSESVRDSLIFLSKISLTLTIMDTWHKSHKESLFDLLLKS